MAYSRPYGQAQGASPWSSGVPPGLQQQQQQQQQAQQPMFNQPMGAFDISGAWQAQQPSQQWVPAMQQVQFVPNPAYMQQPVGQMRQQHIQQHRPMHQRSLSAPRIGVNGLKRPMNMNQNNSGGSQQHRNRSQQNNNNSHNNNNNQYQHRGKGQYNNNTNPNTNSNGGINNNNNNNKQQHQQQKQQATKQPAIRKTKVTKVKKLVTLKSKQNSKPATVVIKVEKATTSDTSVDDANAAVADSNQPAKVQSKTAERKQLKLQARKNAESLKQSKLPVAKAIKAADTSATDDQKADEPIDQAQLKCVPAVFGFVCKLCDVFLRDKNARREHIDSNAHIEKFKASEEEKKVDGEEVKQEVKEEKEVETAVAE